MNWSGDIYREQSGEYVIETSYSYLGSFSVLKFGGKIIGYARDSEEAKTKALAHAEAT